MFIETERLVLRKFQEDDFNDFCEYAMDDEMCRMMGRKLMHSREDAVGILIGSKIKKNDAMGWPIRTQVELLAILLFVLFLQNF